MTWFLILCSIASITSAFASNKCDPSEDNNSSLKVEVAKGHVSLAEYNYASAAPSKEQKDILECLLLKKFKEIDMGSLMPIKSWLEQTHAARVMQLKQSLKDENEAYDDLSSKVDKAIRKND